MNLKNYILEYISSGRGGKKRSGTPVDPDTVLGRGDMVRIKDQKWFDSLEHDNFGYGIVKDGEVDVVFTPRMQEFLGEVVKITKVKFNHKTKSPRYSVELIDIKDSNDLDMYVFINEMLEYI